jgi:hypothetical protein
MVGARIEMLQPAVTPSAPRPQGAEPITSAREHNACGMQLGHPARQAQFRRARRKIERRLKRLPG